MPDMIQANETGTSLRVHLIPRAKRDEVVGVHGDALKIRITAPPVEGAANEALIKFLSKMLHLGKSQVEIVSGTTSRQKLVNIVGLDPATVREILLEPSRFKK